MKNRRSTAQRSQPSGSVSIPPGADKHAILGEHRRGQAALASQARVLRKKTLSELSFTAGALSSVAKVMVPGKRAVAEAYKNDRERMRLFLEKQPPIILAPPYPPGRLPTRAPYLLGCQRAPFDYQLPDMVSGTGISDKATGLLTWKNQIAGKIGQSAGTSYAALTSPALGTLHYIRSGSMISVTVTATVSARIVRNSVPLLGWTSASLSLFAAVGYGFIEGFQREITTIYPYNPSTGPDIFSITAQTYSCRVRIPVLSGWRNRWVPCLAVLSGTIRVSGWADALIDCAMRVERICVDVA